jgi:hypothetical protein
VGERVAWAPMGASLTPPLARPAPSVTPGLAGRLASRLVPPSLAVVVGAVLLRVITGVGFANYDTLYALAWGGQLSRGQLPSYGVPIAPTPHPLLEAIGLVLAPLGPRAAEHVTVALGFFALAGCGLVVYRLAAAQFGRAAGAVAALVLLTRVPILSYGVRAYVDVPYLLLVLGALLVETRRRRAGAPVLVLLALAGLLRPEAWAFSGVYWLYLLRGRRAGESLAPYARLAALAASAPLLWLASDLAVTGKPLWSLTNTRHTAHTLKRVTGIGNVPQYIPRRIGEILRPPVLAGAAVGGVLSLLWLRSRALGAALAGVLAVVVFAVLAAAGLSINTRYAFPAAAVLCVFCGAGVFGWTQLERADPTRRWWAIAGALVLVALAAYAPSQYRSGDREMDKLARQQQIQGDLVALVDDHALSLRCGPVGVPNHAPIPLLALYLKTSPTRIVSAQVVQIGDGQYLDPASREVEESYVLDPHDPHVAVSVPAGFSRLSANRSWTLLQRC